MYAKREVYSLPFFDMMGEYFFDPYPMTFILKNTQKLPTLGITLETYEHDRTGAMHYHFAADNNENVFMVALRTMP